MKSVIKKFTKSVRNFNKAIIQAGGSQFSLDDLESISALELIDIISCNDIEFKYIGLPPEAGNSSKGGSK